MHLPTGFSKSRQLKLRVALASLSLLLLDWAKIFQRKRYSQLQISEHLTRGGLNHSSSLCINKFVFMQSHGEGRRMKEIYAIQILRIRAFLQYVSKLFVCGTHGPLPSYASVLAPILLVAKT